MSEPSAPIELRLQEKPAASPGVVNWSVLEELYGYVGFRRPPLGSVAIPSEADLAEFVEQFLTDEVRAKVKAFRVETMVEEAP